VVESSNFDTMKANNSTESIKVSSKILKKVRSHVGKTKQTIGGFYDLAAQKGISTVINKKGKYFWIKENGAYKVLYTEGEVVTFIAKSDTSEKADFLSKAANQFDFDLYELTEKIIN